MVETWYLSTEMHAIFYFQSDGCLYTVAVAKRERAYIDRFTSSDFFQLQHSYLYSSGLASNLHANTVASSTHSLENELKYTKQVNIFSLLNKTGQCRRRHLKNFFNCITLTLPLVVHLTLLEFYWDGFYTRPRIPKFLSRR